MNEALWLTSSDPAAMLNSLWLEGDPSVQGGNGKPASDRKQRLFACAITRLFFPQFTDGMRRVIEVAERMADGLATDEDYYLAAHEEHRAEDRSGDVKLRVLIHKASANLSWDGPFLADGTTEYALYLQPSAREAIAALLREIFGNPWRSLTLCGMERKPFHNQYAHVDANGGFWLEAECPACATIREKDAVKCLARLIDSEGRYDAGSMAALADELEMAGCDALVLLQHLRGYEPCYSHDTAGDACDLCGDHYWVRLRGPHVRGCWALDLIRGKE
jgi:hypothetical protein